MPKTMTIDRLDGTRTVKIKLTPEELDILNNSIFIWRSLSSHFPGLQEPTEELAKILYTKFTDGTCKTVQEI